jgi:hypothetical protein
MLTFSGIAALMGDTGKRVLFNPLATNGIGKELADKLQSFHNRCCGKSLVQVVLPKPLSLRPANGM